MSKLYNITLFSWNSKPRKILYPYFINFSYPQKKLRHGVTGLFEEKENIYEIYRKMRYSLCYFESWGGCLQTLPLGNETFKEFFFLFKKQKNVLEYEERKIVRYFVTIKPNGVALPYSRLPLKLLNINRALQQSLIIKLLCLQQNWKDRKREISINLFLKMVSDVKV